MGQMALERPLPPVRKRLLGAQGENPAIKEVVRWEEGRRERGIDRLQSDGGARVSFEPVALPSAPSQKTIWHSPARDKLRGGASGLTNRGLLPFSIGCLYEHIYLPKD